MADITLKNLGDIPVVEPNESTHLLAEQDGAYARVPKDKVGAGGGALKVVMTATSHASGTASASAQEIAEAIHAGTHVYAVFESTANMVYYPSAYSLEGIVLFSSVAVTGDTIQSATITMRDGYNYELTSTNHSLSTT